MPAEQNIAAVKKFVEVGLNQKNYPSIAEELAQPDLILEAPGVPTEAGRANGYQIAWDSVVGFTNAFPDLVCDIAHIVANGETVSVDLPYHGTQEQDFMGVPATHKHVKGGELWWIDFRDGKFSRIRICEYGTPLRAALLAAQNS